MATEVVKIIDPDMGTGYDYDSLADWNAGEAGDLTGVRDEIAVAKCRCTGGTADTTSTTIDGWTTDSTHYIKVWTDPAESYRHNGTWQTGNKYRLTSAAYWASLYLNNAAVLHIQIDGLQIEHTGDTSTVGGLIIDSGMSGESYANIYIKITNCVLRRTVAHTNGAAAGFYGVGYHTSGLYTIIFCNNIVYDCVRGFCFTTTTASGIATLVAYNNTIADSSEYGIFPSANWVSGILTAYIKNNIVVGSSTQDYYRQDPAFGTYYTAANITSDDSSPDGESFWSKVVDFVNEGTNDFHLDPSDTVAKGNGTNLYNDAVYPFQTDIDGQDRGGSSASWEIGADELRATEVVKIVDPDMGAGYDYDSLADWSAGEAGNLTGVRDEIAVAKCRCTGGTADTSTFVMSSDWITSSGNYIKIWTDPAEGYRHNGTFQTGNKYRRNTVDGFYCILSYAGHVHFDGIAFSDSVQMSAYGFYAYRNCAYLEFKNCVFKNNGVGIDEGNIAVKLVLENCILHDHSFSPLWILGTGSAFLYNVTVVNCADGIYNYETGAVVCKNVISSNAQLDFYVSNGPITNYNCISKDGSAVNFGGSGNKANINLTFANAGGGNYHLSASDTDAIGAGIGLISDADHAFNTDIDGDIRGAVWDIGADELYGEVVGVAKINKMSQADITKISKVGYTPINLIQKAGGGTFG